MLIPALAPAVLTRATECTGRQHRFVCLQVVAALAVAETCLHFEHRDLHWGNLLLHSVPASREPLPYCLRGRHYEVKQCGIHVSLVDFSLSRCELPGGQHLAKDLNALQDEDGTPWLFAQQLRDDMPQVCCVCLCRNTAAAKRAR